MSESGVSLSRRFFKAHGLGNDYLVFEVERGSTAWDLSAGSVRAVCDRHTGPGSDGLVALLDRSPGDGVFPLRMFNPDGSEFERSGNGLRILASHLVREGLVGTTPFRVRSGGSLIEMEVLGEESGEFDVRVDMGRAETGIEAVAGDPERLDSDGCAIHPVAGPIGFTPVRVGNPHAVVFPDSGSVPLDEVGPFLERHPAFGEGVNVQIVHPRDRSTIEIEIWERGVGPTAASGTSSCAAAVASVLRDLVDPGQVAVEMRGGRLYVTVTPELDVTLRGPVREVCEGVLAEGFANALSS